MAKIKTRARQLAEEWEEKPRIGTSAIGNLLRYFLTFALQTSIPSPTFEATMRQATKVTRAPRRTSPPNTMYLLGMHILAYLQLKKAGF